LLSALVYRTINCEVFTARFVVGDSLLLLLLLLPPGGGSVRPHAHVRFVREQAFVHMIL
jgi:hypothetical protein